MEPILEVRDVSKRFATRLRYALSYGLANIVRACFGTAPSEALRPGEFWALDGISFELRRGEALAILGANGSGKTTLFKIVYGILKPDRGEVCLRGSVYGLMELGVGLEPRLSGRENIALRAAMNHRTPSSRRAAAAAAAEFSELGEDLDKPVQAYSSGMKARLSFAMAATAEADLLIIDEAMAVGDAAFQYKCISFLSEYLAGGGALILTSHQPGPIDVLCKRALLLRDGEAVAFGDVGVALSILLAPPEIMATPFRAGSGMPVAIENVSIVGVDGGPLLTHGVMEIRVQCRVTKSMEVMWGFGVWTPDRSAFVFGEFTKNGETLPLGECELVCRVPDLPLLPGNYCSGILISDPRVSHEICSVGWAANGIPFSVDSDAVPTAVANAKRAHRQLVDVKVLWGDLVHDAAS